MWRRITQVMRLTTYCSLSTPLQRSIKDAEQIKVCSTDQSNGQHMID